jgi:hypothetical protein
MAQWLSTSRKLRPWLHMQSNLMRAEMPTPTERSTRGSIRTTHSSSNKASRPPWESSYLCVCARFLETELLCYLSRRLSHCLRRSSSLVMADPVSIAGLSLQVVQILAPIVIAIGKAIRDGKSVHSSLHDLQSDLEAVYELSDNIHRLFSVSSFTKAVHDVQDDTNVTLEDSLRRALEGCSKEAQRLHDILLRLGLQVRGNLAAKAYLQWRLDRRMDDIDRMKRNFQDHKSSIQLAFQLLTT